MSHLLQMRGLKLFGALLSGFGYLSHLLQMRGLKQKFKLCKKETLCRIFYRCVD